MTSPDLKLLASEAVRLAHAAAVERDKGFYGTCAEKATRHLVDHGPAIAAGYLAAVEENEKLRKVVDAADGFAFARRAVIRRCDGQSVDVQMEAVERVMDALRVYHAAIDAALGAEGAPR